MVFYRCSECGEFYESRDINCILGVFVCKNCYPAGSEYHCDEIEFSSSKYAYQSKNPTETCQLKFNPKLMICKDCKGYKKCKKGYDKKNSLERFFDI